MITDQNPAMLIIMRMAADVATSFYLHDQVQEEEVPKAAAVAGDAALDRCCEALRAQ